jgi:hypothetical protein
MTYSPICVIVEFYRGQKGNAKPMEIRGGHGNNRNTKYLEIGSSGKTTIEFLDGLRGYEVQGPAELFILRKREDGNPALVENGDVVGVYFPD